MFWFGFFAVVLLILFVLVAIAGGFLKLFMEYPIQVIFGIFALIVYIIVQLAQ